MGIADRIRSLRHKRGWTQEELAIRAKTTKVSVSRWERGEASPRLHQLRRLADAFGITLSELSGDRILVRGEPGLRASAQKAGVPKRLASALEQVGRLFEKTSQGTTPNWRSFIQVVDALLIQADAPSRAKDRKSGPTRLAG